MLEICGTSPTRLWRNNPYEVSGAAGIKGIPPSPICQEELSKYVEIPLNAYRLKYYNSQYYISTTVITCLLLTSYCKPKFLGKLHGK